MPTVEATMPKRDTSNVYFNEPGRNDVYNRRFLLPGTRQEGFASLARGETNTRELSEAWSPTTW
ncbi:putative helicase [Ktedonobacter racemifer DSM 44963]|uniref:Putative helicase n=1 Tax=Ktedonobacter racemifer DSM 44963 TaxID=485913 RepID=D6TGL4_KTERA|nr:putative helicase [Ktedonobacter racemifer DSM 44963]